MIIQQAEMICEENMKTRMCVMSGLLYFSRLVFLFDDYFIFYSLLIVNGLLGNDWTWRYTTTYVIEQKLSVNDFLVAHL